jgi:hypothetical protein
MDKCYIQLSKLGDILGILPIAYAAHLRGEKVGVMASAEYSNILDGCGYLEKVVFDDKPWQIEKAVTEAKKLCLNVVCTMTNGPVKTVEKFCYEPAGQKGAEADSFCRESFKLAGCLKEWGKTPLIFDQRDKTREAALLAEFNLLRAGRKKRLMLISVGSPSSSSPFPYRNLLLELVTLKYGKDYRIINLADVKAHRFYDLLALYEMAHCLITVDTSHLHLAAAVPSLPVMALIQDKPIYWHGSAWRPQHHFFCRYRDFPWRALELFTAIENIGTKQISNILHCYHGSVRGNDFARYFPIQYGACRRDSANVLGDKEHLPMLQDSIRMIMQAAKPDDFIVLTREDTKISSFYGKDFPVDKNPASYAYRMNRDKDGNDTFVPAIDLFAAPVGFWVEIFNEIPDIVMGLDNYWGRLLMEIFRKHGAVEIEGIYRNE